uniref:Uncharacterized protein n=2 Tax=Physcomitrium patens TaxID=3218 RepID=A0A2K1K6W1_PHYPA|nr:hypothetical protein PHYPA_011415 [Physcomitrium patens]
MGKKNCQNYVHVSSSRWSAKICSISSIIIVIRILTLFVLIFFLLFGYLSIWSGGHLHNHINRTRRFVQCDIGCYQAQGDICYAVLAIGVWQQRCQCFRGYHSCEILQLVNSSIQSIRISLWQVAIYERDAGLRMTISGRGIGRFLLMRITWLHQSL